ncbi:hypothetical protein [Parapedobacter koreensis]|uniref:Uncharacterized protein n=1 Tax=Parapedobacter koreensis TaxID=332977 RepID=A0A1H7GCH4_9SPHI|nr:hypothetical protein [Parapedobacter koreensis]SEK35167.1 hypothetical protein SAMN05421740_101629 [Parapedobacter koreensis]
MKEFDEIQQLWHRQEPEPNVSFEAILKRIKGNKAALARKLLWQIVAVAPATIILLWMIIAVQFSTWTTYLACVIMVGCVCYYFFTQLADYHNIRKSHHLLAKPQDYIHYLKAFQQKRNHFNTRNYAVYEACIAVAFALYSIEMYFVLPFWTFVGSIIFIVFWFLICHFVFMKQYIHSENERIEEMIENLERIKGQFRDA